MFAGGFWANSSEVEDAVGGDSGAGFCDGRGADIGANQRQSEYGVSGIGGRGNDTLFYSVSVHVCGGDSAGLPAGSRRKRESGFDSRRQSWSLADGDIGIYRGAGWDCAVLDSAGGSGE